MRQLVFCHGFGFDRHYWDNITPFFEGENCAFVDLGFFNQPYIPKIDPEAKLIGIGHSLGLMKLMQLYPHFDCLIGLNSFTNFLSTEASLKEQRTNELKVLTDNLIADCRGTLRAFYRRCGVRSFIHERINIDRLLDDLELLKSPIALLNAIPVLIIAAKDDIIVPPVVINDNFAGGDNIELKFFEQGKHALGLVKADDIYRQIMDFIDAKSN